MLSLSAHSPALDHLNYTRWQSCLVVSMRCYSTGLQTFAVAILCRRYINYTEVDYMEPFKNAKLVNIKDGLAPLSIADGQTNTMTRTNRVKR